MDPVGYILLLVMSIVLGLYLKPETFWQKFVFLLMLFFLSCLLAAT